MFLSRKKVEDTLIFQSLSLEDQNWKIEIIKFDMHLKKKEDSICNEKVNEVYIDLFPRYIVVEEWL